MPEITSLDGEYFTNAALILCFMTMSCTIADYVEVHDGRVTVCRDAVRGRCTRPTCKYYHIPVPLPPSE